MRLGILDVTVVMLGIFFAVTGFLADITALTFIGGTWLGGFMFKLGYIWEENRENR